MLCEADWNMECDVYWPEPGASMSPEPGLIVFCEAMNSFNQIVTVRTFTISYQGLSRRIYHVQQHEWPDHGPLNHPDQLLQLNYLVKSLQKRVEDGTVHPLVVHCSAGCGRTGTFITMSVILERVFGHSGTPYHDTDVILDIVRELRPQRMMFIQSLCQLEFLYQTFLRRLQLESEHSFDNKISGPLDSFLARIR